MMEIAKVFHNGNRQVVRLPDKYRFTCKEVTGSLLILTPKDKIRDNYWSYTTASELMIQYPLC